MADADPPATEAPRATTLPTHEAHEAQDHDIGKDAAETKVTSHDVAVEGKDEASHDAAEISPTKGEPAEPMSKVRAMAPDSNRAKGALQQTIGSAKEALGELLHMEKLRKEGEEQRKEGEAREEAALKKMPGSGVTDAVESGLRKAVKTLKGERKSSVSDSPAGARRSSADGAATDPGVNVNDVPADLTGTGVATHDHAEQPIPGTTQEASAAHHGGDSAEPTTIAVDAKLEAQAVAGDSYAGHGPGIDTQVEHKPVVGEAHHEPNLGINEGDARPETVGLKDGESTGLPEGGIGRTS